MKEDFPKKIPLKPRHYLTQVRVTSHRRAITKLLFGEDQYALHAVHHIPREERLCRMCHVAIESPHHVLMQCTADILCTPEYLHQHPCLTVPANYPKSYGAA
jgi:hypothetical protein